MYLKPVFVILRTKSWTPTGGNKSKIKAAYTTFLRRISRKISRNRTVNEIFRDVGSQNFITEIEDKLL